MSNLYWRTTVGQLTFDGVCVDLIFDVIVWYRSIKTTWEYYIETSHQKDREWELKGSRQYHETPSKDAIFRLRDI